MKHELHTLHSTVNNFIQSPHCFMSKRNSPFNTCTTCMSLLLQLKLCIQKYNYYIKLIHETVNLKTKFQDSHYHMIIISCVCVCARFCFLPIIISNTQSTIHSCCGYNHTLLDRHHDKSKYTITFTTATP